LSTSTTTGLKLIAVDNHSTNLLLSLNADLAKAQRHPGRVGTIADITQDWNEALSGIYEEGVEGFITWLGRQTRPPNVVDFFAECDTRRGNPREEPDDS